jgi:trans-aconitate methyltransferase
VNTDADLLRTRIEILPAITERLRDGIDVVDFGCGLGHDLNVMARAFPKSRFTGFDIAEDRLAGGRAEATMAANQRSVRVAGRSCT